MLRRRVAVFDIDGVMANYEEGFMDWLQRKVFVRYGCSADAKELLGRTKYEELKSLYRSSGAKRELSLAEPSLPAKLASLKAAGFEIAILSSRPAHEFSNIYTDTFIWLSENGLWFDALLFAEKKHLTIQLNFPDVVCYVVEDTLSQARSICDFFKDSTVTVLYVCRADDEREVCLNSKGFVVVASASEAVDRILSSEKSRRE